MILGSCLYHVIRDVRYIAAALTSIAKTIPLSPKATPYYIFIENLTIIYTTSHRYVLELRLWRIKFYSGLIYGFLRCLVCRSKVRS
jgi:hypothetical protein